MGVWNGWGYGVAFFGALNFKILGDAPEQIFGGSQEVVFQRVLLAAVPPERKPERGVHSRVNSPGTKSERGYVCMFPRNKTGTRLHSPKPPFYETVSNRPFVSR